MVQHHNEIRLKITPLVDELILVGMKISMQKHKSQIGGGEPTYLAESITMLTKIESDLFQDIVGTITRECELIIANAKQP